MSATFGSNYADIYDRMYAAKDYARECDLIVSAAGSSDDLRILDMGCGTGGHALTLARLGHTVTGVDVSREMLRVAAAKSTEQSLPIEWHVGDATNTRVEGHFDVVVFMFAVLGYLTETHRLLTALQNARRHLQPGGKLIFDVWYGPGVLTQKPEQRVKVIPQDDGCLIRAVTPVLRTEQNIVDVHARIWHIVGDRVVFDFSELHPVRYFFIPELEHFLAQSSFDVEAFFEFPELHSELTAQAWNLGCVATAIR